MLSLSLEILFISQVCIELLDQCTNYKQTDMEEWCIDTNPAFKLFIKDLVTCKCQDNRWMIEFGGRSSPKPLLTFQIQAKILQITGFKDDILIIDDQTGKAKATRKPEVPGDFSWMKVGVICSIVGSLADGGKLPHIEIIKMTKMANPLQEDLWPLEVQELRNFLSKTVAPVVEVPQNILV